MCRLEEIDNLIEEKRQEIVKLKEEKQEIQLGLLNKTMFGKYWYFDNSSEAPIELSGKYVYWNHEAFLFKYGKGPLGEDEYRIVINATTMKCVVTEYADETYLSYDMQEQILIPYNHTIMKDIINSAKEISVDEFKDAVVNEFEKAKDDFISAVEEEKKKP